MFLLMRWNWSKRKKTGMESFPNVQSLWTWTLLGIHFRERVKDVNVSVSGPDGVVYNEWFTTPAARSVQVDLSPYQDGRYEILFFDADGNEAEGSFLKEED